MNSPTSSSSSLHFTSKSLTSSTLDSPIIQEPEYSPDSYFPDFSTLTIDSSSNGNSSNLYLSPGSSFDASCFDLPVAHSNESINSQLAGWLLNPDHLNFLKPVGYGAFSTVFLGTYQNDICAIKKFNHQKSNKDSQLQTLEQEANLLGSLGDHPNIIEFLGICVKDDQYLLVMEFASGGTLDSLLKKTETTLYSVISWIKQIASGMHHLHSGAERPIVHRDLKTGNILVSNTGVLKISDFGISKYFDHTTKMTFAGTPATMAPEIVRGEICSEKVDIWSFGIVYWEILTKQTPYESLDSYALIFQIGSRNLHPPIPSDCPKQMAQLMESCWDPIPKKRPSFKQILSVIDSLTQQLSNQDIIESITDKQSEWRKETINSYKSTGLSFSGAENAPFGHMALLEIKSQFTELFSIINESATKVWDSSMSLLKPLPERIVTMIFQEVKSNRAQRRSTITLDNSPKQLSPDPFNYIHGSSSSFSPRETKGALYMNYATLRAGPEKSPKYDVRVAMKEVAKRAAEPMLMSFQTKIDEIYTKALDFIVEQLKTWKKKGFAERISDEVLVRLQNQVVHDTTMSRVRDYTTNHIDKVINEVQPLHLSMDRERVQEFFHRGLSTRFHLKAFSKEIMALTIDVIELDLLRIHYLILEGATK